MSDDVRIADELRALSPVDKLRLAAGLLSSAEDEPRRKQPSILRTAGKIAALAASEIADLATAMEVLG